ncbi:hypothetical protein OF381_10420 [Mannheimia haemolytica]
MKNHPLTLSQQEITLEIEAARQAWLYENRYCAAFDYINKYLQAQYEKIESEMLKNEPEIDGFLGPLTRLENAYKNNPELGERLDRVRRLLEKRGEQLSTREKTRINAMTTEEIENSLP